LIGSLPSARGSFLLANPLNKLKRGFASYSRDVREELAKNGHDTPEDGERNRRIGDDEEASIVAEMHRLIAAATADIERAGYEARILMCRNPTDRPGASWHWRSQLQISSFAAGTAALTARSITPR
jgi:hypothetical protein